MRRAIFLAFVAWLGWTATAGAAGLIIVHDADFWRHPHPVPPPHRPVPPPRVRPWTPLEVNFVKANAEISDQVAVTRIEEEFYNPNSRQLEGTFLFPVPKGAHLDRFTMEINGKQVEAELLKADKARKIYEDIVRNLRDPALLEYAGQDLFKVRIFPIEPRSTKLITLSYTQLLESDNGLVDYVFPLNTKKYSAKPLRSVSLTVDIKTRRPLKSLYSPSHQVEIQRHGRNKAKIGFEASNVRPDMDLQLMFSQDTEDLGLSLLTHRTGDEDGYFVLLASPGARAKTTRALPKDVVFVLDTSGSMSGSKLRQARNALSFCVENLNEEDRFDILRFSTEVEPLFNQLQKASETNQDKARQFLKKLNSIGGTAIDAALQKAIALRPDSTKRPYVIVFLTDGRPTVGNTDIQHIIKGVTRDKESMTRIFCFGLGTDVNTHLLDRLTEETKAFSQYVLPEEDIEIKLSNFFTKIKEPVLTNPELDLPDGIRVTRMHPAQLPDLFYGQQLVVVGRYSGQGKGEITLKGDVAGKRKSFSYDTRFPGKKDKHAFVPRLWATRRVGYLLDEIRLRGENKELVDEVTQLARNYGIVTPYTAFLILEDEQQRGIASNRRLLEESLYHRESRDNFSRAYRELSKSTSGDAAVGGARSISRLKSAPAAPSLAQANQDALLAPSTSPTVTSAPRTAATAPVRSRGASASPRMDLARELASQGHFVAGRTFYKKQTNWVDSRVLDLEKPKTRRIQFNSAEYYSFLAKNPSVRPWLALGRSVQFEWQGAIIEIYE